MDLEILEKQEEKQIDNKYKSENKEKIELLVEEEVTIENQNKFLQTTLGKVINTGIDIGLRGVMPDMIEDQIIEIKNVLLKYLILVLIVIFWFL